MNDATRREIDKACRDTLRDAGLAAPPIRAESVLQFLELYRQFYDLQDPSFLDRAKHKLVVNGRKLVQIVKKICRQQLAIRPPFWLMGKGLRSLLAEEEPHTNR